MKIDYTSIHQLKNVYIHDSEFTGYEYDYTNRRISFACRNIFSKKKLVFQFNNVIYSTLQSCTFWGGGNSILWLNVLDEDAGLNALYELQRKNQDNFALSDLDQGIEYIITEITINSGDKLLIVSQWIEFIETAL